MSSFVWWEAETNIATREVNVPLPAANKGSALLLLASSRRGIQPITAKDSTQLIPINHQSPLKQLFSELISVSHKLVLLKINFRKSSENHLWFPHDTTFTYHVATTRGPATLTLKKQTHASSAAPVSASSSSRHLLTSFSC